MFDYGGMKWPRLKEFAGSTRHLSELRAGVIFFGALALFTILVFTTLGDFAKPPYRVLITYIGILFLLAMLTEELPRLFLIMLIALNGLAIVIGILGGTAFLFSDKFEDLKIVSPVLAVYSVVILLLSLRSYALSKRN